MSHLALNPDFGSCFYLWIPLDQSKEEIQAELERAYEYNKLVNQMLDGSINPIDLLDAANDLNIDCDEYLDEVEQNVVDWIYENANELGESTLEELAIYV